MSLVVGFHVKGENPKSCESGVKIRVLQGDRVFESVHHTSQSNVCKEGIVTFQEGGEMNQLSASLTL